MDERSPQDVSDLLKIMAQLRDPETGCPWDVKQDFSTIAPYTIEEAYEVADAIDRGDMADLKDELGDLLLQVVFHAQMAEEAGEFAFGDVVAAICDKMTRRHPHVFPAAANENLARLGVPDAQTAPGMVRFANVEAQTAAWEMLKKAERQAKGELDTSALAGISRGLPEWQRAIKLQKRAAAVGFDWPTVEPVFDKLHEEIDEVRAEFERGIGHDALEDEIGDVLFVVANLARHGKVDFGNALRRANHKFERRYRRMEVLAKLDGADLPALSLDDQDAYWNRAKAEEKTA